MQYDEFQLDFSLKLTANVQALNDVGQNFALR